MKKTNEILGIETGAWIALFIFSIILMIAINTYGNFIYERAYNKGWFDKYNNKTHFFLQIKENKIKMEQHNYTLMDEVPCHPCYDKNNIIINSSLTNKLLNFTVQ